VPGKLQRVFWHIDRLEKHGHSLSKDEYDGELRSVNKALLDIFRRLDISEDRALGLENVPTKFRSNLPDRLPTPDLSLPTPAAIRPEEFESSDIPLLSNQQLILGTNELSLQLEEPLYRFDAKRSVFKLR